MSWRTLLRDELRDLSPVAASDAEPGAENLVRLDGSVSPYPLPDDVAESLGRHLASVPLHRYPDAAAAGAREACARWLDVGADHLCLGNGADELATIVVQAFGKPRRGEARPRVAYPMPTFAAYRIGAVACGAMPLEVPLRDDFGLDPAILDRHVTGGKPNVIFLARPNNPTGTLWEREIIERFVERRPDCIVAIDEAYAEFAGESMLDLVTARDNLVVIRSLSALGLPGLRAGVLVGHPEVVTELNKVRLPFNLGTLTQSALVFLLENHRERLRERIDQIVAERERVYAALVEGRRCQLYPSRASFILMRVADADATAQALLEKGVVVKNVSRPGPLRSCLRVTIGGPDDNEIFLRAFNEVAAPLPAQAETQAPEQHEEPEEPEEPEETDETD